MKKRWIMITLGTVLVMSLTACDSLKKSDAQLETQATESETETQTTESETETQTTEEETKEKETEAVTKPQPETQTQSPTEALAPQTVAQTEAPSQTPAVIPESAQPETPVQVITETPQTMFEVPPSPPVYEEEYLQCPYCAEWFYAQPDGGLWNPYDRHVLSERDRIEGGQQTEQELAQCPDCLNWYETGNIFRNHICSGRGQEIQE